MARKVEKKWKVETDRYGNVRVRQATDGNFHNVEEAQKFAEMQARENKTVMRIDPAEGFYDEEIAIDFTSILTADELLGKQESEVKIAKAELMVAEVDCDRRKANYVNSDEKYKEENKRIYIASKDRLKKAKLGLRDAKRKLKESKKAAKNK